MDRFKVWLRRNAKQNQKAVLVWCESADEVPAAVALVEPFGRWEVAVACPWPEGSPEPHATTEEIFGW